MTSFKLCEVSTSSFVLTNIPVSESCLSLQILFKDNWPLLSIVLDQWRSRRTIWLQSSIKRTTLPWIIWLLCLLHKHTGVF